MVDPAAVPARSFDLYDQRPEQVMEPPRSLGSILRRIGPGMILAASIVGSGELIATTTLGAEVGCQVIATGQTGAEAFNIVPGPRLLGVCWVLWAWMMMLLVTFSMFGGM